MDESELKLALTELKKDLAKFNYVYARSDGLGVEDSANKANRSKSWYYALPKDEQAYLEMIAAELNAAAKFRAKQILDDATVKAAKVKVEGLKARSDQIKQSVATEILDRTIGKTTTPIDVTSQGDKIIVTIKGQDD